MAPVTIMAAKVGAKSPRVCRKGASNQGPHDNPKVNKKNQMIGDLLIDFFIIFIDRLLIAKKFTVFNIIRKEGNFDRNHDFKPGRQKKSGIWCQAKFIVWEAMGQFFQPVPHGSPKLSGYPLLSA
jgi:hypothetical protein